MDEIKNRWSIVIGIYDQYELFRQLFESILFNVSVKEIIVVDDYSYPEGKLRAYEDYIYDTYPVVRLIKKDEYRVSFHSNESDRRIDHKINVERNMNMSYTNMGHAYALQVGADTVETDFVLLLDADVVMLKKSKDLLQKLTDIFDDHSDVMCIGQLAGFMSDELIKVNRNFNFSYVGKPNTEGGCPGSPAVAVRMDCWKKYGVDPLAVGPRRVGWAYAWFIKDVFNKGFAAANFPIMSDKYVFHVGGGIFVNSRGSRRQDGKFGMCKDTARYGGRVGYDLNQEWYHGRHILDMTSKEYAEYLKSKYDVPFQNIQGPLPEDKLYIPKHEIKPTILDDGII